MSGKIWNNQMGLIKSILARVKTDSKGQVFMQPMHAYHLNKRMGIGKKNGTEDMRDTNVTNRRKGL